MDHFRIKAKAICDLLSDHPHLTKKQSLQYRKWFNEIIEPVAASEEIDLLDLNSPPSEDELNVLFSN